MTKQTDTLIAAGRRELRWWRQAERRAVTDHERQVSQTLRRLAAARTPVLAADDGPHRQGAAARAGLIRLTLPGWEVALAGVAPGPRSAVAGHGPMRLADAGRYGRFWWIRISAGPGHGRDRAIMLLGSHLRLSPGRPGAARAASPVRGPEITAPARAAISGIIAAQPADSGHTAGMRSLPTDEAVRAAAQRLRADLTADGLGRAVAAYYTTPAFAGMTFSNLGRNPADEITSDDLLAVTLLDIVWRPQVVRILLGSQQQELSRMLAAIPADLDLWHAPDEVSKHIDAIWDALLAIDGIGTASATKLLARKRPRLCPISDSVVIKAVGVPGRTWDVLRCLLQDPAALAQVEALRPAAAAEASLLRILDVILWISHSDSAAARWVREEAGMAVPAPAPEPVRALG
jgi:hypothetical protein